MNRIEEEKKRLRRELLRIESLPPAEGPLSAEDIHTHRYPDNRGYGSYCKKLPRLESVVKNGLRILDVGAGSCRALSEIGARFSVCELHSTGIVEQDVSGINNVVAFSDRLPLRDDFSI